MVISIMVVIYIRISLVVKCCFVMLLIIILIIFGGISCSIVIMISKVIVLR